MVENRSSGTIGKQNWYCVLLCYVDLRARHAADTHGLDFSHRLQKDITYKDCHTVALLKAETGNRRAILEA